MVTALKSKRAFVGHWGVFAQRIIHSYMTTDTAFLYACAHDDFLNGVFIMLRHMMTSPLMQHHEP